MIRHRYLLTNRVFTVLSYPVSFLQQRDSRDGFATGAYIKIGYFVKVGAFGDNSEVIEDLQYQDVIEDPLILQVDKSIDILFSKYFRGLVDYEGVQRIETHMLTKAIS